MFYCRVQKLRVDGGKCSRRIYFIIREKLKRKKEKLSLGFESPSEASCCLLVLTNGTAIYVFIYLLTPNNNKEHRVFY